MLLTPFEVTHSCFRYDHVMIFLCTHSDVERGDLFWEPAGTLAVADVSSFLSGTYQY